MWWKKLKGNVHWWVASEWERLKKWSRWSLVFEADAELGVLRVQLHKRGCVVGDWTFPASLLEHWAQILKSKRSQSDATGAGPRV